MIEIERKFLVRNMDWGEPLYRRRIEQGYLFIAPDRNLRIRRADDKYILTLKVQGEGLARHEIETDVEPEQGQKMLDDLCVERPITKTRHVVSYQGKTWEIDIFEAENTGLIVAEIELARQDESFALPDWAGPEVTDDARFFNAALSSAPFSQWGVSYGELLAGKGGA